MQENILSNRQQILLDRIKVLGKAHISQLKMVYTSQIALKQGLKRLERLGLVKMIDFGYFQYVGDE